MAEKDARLAINNAVEQLEQVSAIVQETRQLKSLKPGFRTMKCIVEELEGQENHPDERLLQQVRDIAYETQDVIGSVVADTNLQRQSKLGRLLSGGKATKHVEEIENMKGRIQRVCSFKDVASSNKESNHGRSFSMSRNKEVVGFQDAKDALVRQLMDGAKSKREVILILGKAGSGKTTLARMVCEGGFLQLEFLHIENLVVETWKLKSGAMQGVKRFLKGDGIDLKTAPDYLKGVVYPIRDEGNGTC